MGKREDILDNIVTTLEGISVSGGYNYNVGLATRETTDWMRLKNEQLPAAVIQWTEDEREVRPLQGEYLLSTLTVTIRGVVDASPHINENIDEVVNKWSEDIEKALAVDGTRDSNAMYTNPTLLRAYDLPPETRREVFDFTFTIMYNYLEGAP